MVYLSDIKIILDQVLSDEKLINSKSFKGIVYKDEPIIRTASQLNKYSTPKKIKEMKEIMYLPEAYWKTSAWLFYSQGKFMEYYEDNFVYNEEFTKYYPCYRDLSVEQLRGYFTWRKYVRNNMIQRAPLPFVYIYIYELLNCIGFESPEECFIVLKNFCKEYLKYDNSVKKYTENWLIDFIVYYELSPELIQDVHDIMYDTSLLTLMHWDQHNDNEVFQAISDLSSYQIKESLYYKTYPDEFKKVLINSFKKISEFFTAKRKLSFFTNLFGNIVECNHNMFQSAIFYDRQPLRNCEFSINEIHNYTCINGRWSCKKISGNRNKNSKLGDLVKVVDSLLREKNNFRYKLSCADVSKTTMKLIQNAIDEYYAEIKRIESQMITIDLSKLDEIRKSADITREKLLVDEEEYEITEIFVNKKDASEVPCIYPESQLDKDEKEFLIALLYNSDFMAIARKYGKMPSILADSINGKLFDSFSDIVIDFSDDGPYIINDYLDEIKKCFIRSKK